MEPPATADRTRLLSPEANAPRHHPPTHGIPTQSTATARCSVLLIPSIVDQIVGFLSSSVSCSANTSTTGGRGKAILFLTTIVNLCRIVPRASPFVQPPLGDRYGPSNQSFWITKLFEMYDFAIDPRQILNPDNENGLETSRDLSYARQASAIAAWRRARGLPVQDEEQEDDEEEEEEEEDEDEEEELPFFVEDYSLWSSLGVYFRRSEYGFLTQIQDGTLAKTAFHDAINAYELFHDLAILVEIIRPCGIISTRNPLVWVSLYPCLLGQMDAKITPRGSDLLELCALTPHFWDAREEQMVSGHWSGLSENAILQLNTANYDENIHPSEFLAPVATIEKTPFFVENVVQASQETRLKQLVRQYLVDWRQVKVAEGPQFYIGKRNKTNRWMGFISVRDNYY